MNKDLLTFQEWLLVQRLKYALQDQRFSKLPLISYKEYLETVDNYWTKADTINT